MSRAERLDDVVEELSSRGLRQVELYAKRGRSRRVEVGSHGSLASNGVEEGWAVRAGDSKTSFFAAATGLPDPAGPWPRPEPPGLRLPGLAPLRPWRSPPDLEAPLAGEREALAVLEGFEAELARLLPGARLVRGVLEDGASTAELLSSHELRATVRRRLANLRLEVVGPGRSPASVRLEVAARQARDLAPRALARQAVDRLIVRQDGRPVERDRGEIVVAPAVAVRLLAGLLPLLLGPEAEARTRALCDRRGRLGSESLTVIDDGRLDGGLLAAAVDGEGTPTRRVTLIEAGAFRQPLLAWFQRAQPRQRSSGCVARSGWRELPSPGPTHLFIQPSPEVRPAELVAATSRGYYLLDADGPGRFDLAADRLALPVSGFTIRQGRAGTPLAGVWLCGGVGALLRGVRAAARDLTFLPVRGMLGAPSMLLSGLEVRGSPG